MDEKHQPAASSTSLPGPHVARVGSLGVLLGARADTKLVRAHDYRPITATMFGTEPVLGGAPIEATAEAA